MRKSIMLAAVVGAMVWAGTSQAAGKEGELGEGTQIILSADRLMPFFAYTNDRTTLEQNNTKTTDSTSNSSLSLLFGRSSNTNIPYTVPRVGFDVAFDRFTVGGNFIAIFGFGGTTEQKVETPGATQTTSRDAPTLTGFGIAPRAGYIIGLSPVFSIWLRGGFSFYTFTVKSTQVNNNGVTNSQSVSRNVFGLDLEPMLVISPVNHFGITVGLPVDIGFAGSQKDETQNGAVTQTVDRSYSAFHFGLGAGLLGYL